MQETKESDIVKGTCWRHKDTQKEFIVTSIRPEYFRYGKMVVSINTRENLKANAEWGGDYDTGDSGYYLEDFLKYFELA